MGKRRVSKLRWGMSDSLETHPSFAGVNAPSLVVLGQTVLCNYEDPLKKFDHSRPPFHSHSRLLEPTTYDFLLVLYSNSGLPCNVSKIKSNNCKIAKLLYLTIRNPYFNISNSTMFGDRE